jgi:N-methylhydantoinase A
VRFPGSEEIEADVYDRYALPPGWVGRGPAVFEEHETSCVVGPDCAVKVDGQHNLIIDIDHGGGEGGAR